MSEFPDHFSARAGAYAAFRPRYPDALFAFLAQTCRARTLAWDCATGNGQAAVGLAAHFPRVLATDASAAQIAQAQAHPRIAYRVARAEASGLADASVDLLTVAQALHWFDLPAFYAEARRVLKPHGVIAVWTYGAFRFESRALDALMQDFYANTLGPYWPPARVHVETGYRRLAFPFEEFGAPAFTLDARLTREALLGYLGTWSAVGRFKAQRGWDPVEELATQLDAVWGEAVEHSVRWPLKLRVGWADAKA
ncbi:class I SAM-dependent methyltransferase [Ectothiorhodospiraceae bacterium 2226]|nr:class I SAM-dependent methyltransferase [Ectothiorhodospiraceae bacterium 2226]